MTAPKYGSDQVIRRQRVLLIITVVALIVCLAGLVAVWNIKSPAQQAAEQSPPPPSVLTAEVTEGVLAQQVITRASVQADSLNLRALTAASPAIVTATPKPAGNSVDEGEVVMEIAGRPIIAMTGASPAYRGLSPDMTGTDVGQLQDGLTRLGYLDNHKHDTFDSATGRAITAMYKDRGYTPSCDGSTVTACLGEVVFIPALPATVASLGVRTGDDASTTEAIMTLQLGAVTVSAIIPGGQETGITPGLTALVADDASKRECTGTVASVGAYTAGSTDTGQAAGYPVTITADGCVDTSWLNLNVRVVIDIQATPEAVLIVPTTAIQTDAGGATYVTVHTDTGTGEATANNTGAADRRVDVTTGLIAQGNIEVTPADGQSLAVGDLVVTG